MPAVFFEGFRIALSPTCTTKARLKEEGLKDLVRLLDQKADAADWRRLSRRLPVRAARGRPAAPAQVREDAVGYHAVLGNNDWRGCW